MVQTNYLYWQIKYQFLHTNLYQKYNVKKVQ
jgi:hypothetical protein